MNPDKHLCCCIASGKGLVDGLKLVYFPRPNFDECCLKSYRRSYRMAIGSVVRKKANGGKK